MWRAGDKARAHDSLQAFEKLCHSLEGEPRFVNEPPLVVPITQLLGADGDRIAAVVARILRSYLRTLQPDRRHLLQQHRLVDTARKVVGVGSVGTNAWIALFLDRDHHIRFCCR